MEANCSDDSMGEESYSALTERVVFPSKTHALNDELLCDFGAALARRHPNNLLGAPPSNQKNREELGQAPEEWFHVRTRMANRENAIMAGTRHEAREVDMR